MNAPIVIFAYNRLSHVHSTIEALKNNILANSSDLIIYSDKESSDENKISVDKVRDYLQSINGFRSVTINYRNINYGLARSIIDGVSEVLKIYERIIVIEDDIVTSPYFLLYMNEALDLFANNEDVASIHGWVFPTSIKLPTAFFLPGADCWGWGTWRRGWQLFNPDGKELLHQLRQRNLLKTFDCNGAFPFSKLLKNQIQGLNNSWAIRWYASAFLANKLTLYPGRTLVNNIGHDCSGVHCRDTNIFHSEFSPYPIDLNNLNVFPSKEGQEAYELFLRTIHSGVINKLFSIFKKLYRI